MNRKDSELVDALKDSLINFSIDENFNVPEAILKLAENTGKIADSITPRHAAGCNQNGVYVESLTEAVCSISASLSEVASGLHAIADAIRGYQE